MECADAQTNLRLVCFDPPATPNQTEENTSPTRILRLKKNPEMSMQAIFRELCASKNYSVSYLECQKDVHGKKSVATSEQVCQKQTFEHNFIVQSI